MNLNKGFGGHDGSQTRDHWIKSPPRYLSAPRARLMNSVGVAPTMNRLRAYRLNYLATSPLMETAGVVETPCSTLQADAWPLCYAVMKDSVGLDPTSSDLEGRCPIH